MPNTRTENALRRQLALKLGRKTIPWDLWHLIDRLGWLELTLEGLMTLDQLVEDVGSVIAYRKHRTHTGPDGHIEIRSNLNTRDLERAWAFSRCVGAVVSEPHVIPRFHPDFQSRKKKELIKSDVTIFRDRYLGGQKLGFAEAKGLVDSQAAEVWSISDFHGRGIPLASHTSRVFYSDVLSLGAMKFARDVIIRVSWPGHSVEEELRHNYLLGDTTGGFIVLQVDVPDFPRIEKKVARSTTLGALATEAKGLSTQYPWSSGQAAWFLLTGDIPFISPLRINAHLTQSSTFGRVLIRMEVEPWIPEKSVVRAFRQARQSLIHGRQRTPTATRSKALSFVAQIPEHPDKQLSWNARWKRWLKKNPDIYMDYRSFQKAVEAAEKTILHPRIKWS